MITKINIKYGKLIDPFLIEYVKNNYPDYSFPNQDEVLKKVETFKEIWAQKEQEVFKFLTENTGLEFQRNIIDCYIVTAINRDMSSPLIIRSRYNEKEFIYTILHELIHILFSDNKVKHMKEYANENKSVKNHIRLFLLIKKYYLDYENDPDFLDEIRSRCDESKNKDYGKAWKIVDTLNYKAPAKYF